MIRLIPMFSLIFVAGAALASPHIVSSSANSGEGSLREAIAKASRANGVQEILITHGDDIVLSSGLNYSGQAPLVITGQAQNIYLQANETLLAVSEGAHLTVNSLRLQGPAGFSINNRGDLNGRTAGKGIFVDVRDDQTGVVRLELNDVTVTGFANHGVHVSDCNLADECGGGGGGAGEGSDASIVVVFNNVEINNVGYGRFDADGLRIDERSVGDIDVTLVNSDFTLVGADGVEFDEGQAGDVRVSVDQVGFTNNGGYCDPELLQAFMPAVDEAEFKDGEVRESAIPQMIKGSPDDRCFEREVDTYDSGFVEAYEFAIDVDDGFDIDEAGPGDLHAVIRRSVIRNNLDEGLDFDEEGEGSIVLSLIDVEATGNTDDGVKNSEADAGDVRGMASGLVSTANGGKGAVFEEEDAGDVRVLVFNSRTESNDDSDNTGIEAVQEGAGFGELTVLDSNIVDGIDAEGVIRK